MIIASPYKLKVSMKNSNICSSCERENSSNMQHAKIQILLKQLITKIIGDSERFISHEQGFPLESAPTHYVVIHKIVYTHIQRHGSLNYLNKSSTAKWVFGGKNCSLANIHIT